MIDEACRLYDWGGVCMVLFAGLHLSVFLLLTTISISLFLRLVYVRYRYLRLGKEVDWQWRFTGAGKYIFGQQKLLKDKRSGWMHVIMFYGFHLLPMFFSFVEEVTIFSVLLATAYAYYRRYIEKLPRLKRGFRAGIVIWLLASLLCSMIICATFEKIWHDEPLTWWTPLSSLLATLFIAWLPPSVASVLFFIGWWAHTLILFAFLLYIPQSKHFHLLVAPFNTLLRREQPILAPIDFSDETAETFGVGKIEDFTQKQLLDLYACVECGRCTEMCPATSTGKTLSPMNLIVNLRDHLTAKGSALTSTSAWLPASLATTGVAEAELIGDVVTEQELWECTTCRNCEDACPVMNEHVDKIIDMRRYLTLTTGEIPMEAVRTLNNIERQGNPWGLSKQDRADWIIESEVPVPTVEEQPVFEYLFFVGSMGSYDMRSKRVTQSVVRLLHHAGVSFAVFGNQEQNSGDTPRRLGNEFLFQQQVEANIALFRKYRVKKLVTIDPHAFHLFKQEYPSFGWNGEVVHHTQLLAQLVQEKKIIPKHHVDVQMTYHDSCYLGRYNGEYDAPRYILAQIPGVRVMEMERNRERAMCCGAGGGLMWLEEKAGKRINLARTEQALQVSPSIIGSACPYCLTMLSDGVKALEADAVETMDIAEMLERAVFG
jgi:Fe-S oxidoreductase